jgi:hypothetical protein
MSYDVNRRTGNSGSDSQNPDYQSKHVGYVPVVNASGVRTNANLILDDIVSYENQLTNGVEYEYTVVANSGQSTNGEKGGQIVTNAKGTARATAQIRNRGDSLQFNASDLEIYPYAQSIKPSTAPGALLVTWKKQPGVTYELTYKYKRPDALDPTSGAFKYASDDYTLTNGGSENLFQTSALDPYGYWQVPDLRIGPADPWDKVEIRAIFKTNYYLPSAIVEKAVPEPTNIVASYDASQAAFAGRFVDKADSISNIKDNYIELTWKALSDVAAEAPYAVWKVEANGNTPASALITDWKKLEETPVEFYEDNAGTSVKKLRIQDKDIVQGHYYKYLLIVTGQNKGQGAVNVTNRSLDPPVAGAPIEVGYSAIQSDPDIFRTSSSTGNNDITFVPTSDGTGVIVKWLTLYDKAKLSELNYSGDLNVYYEVYQAKLTNGSNPGVNDIFLANRTKDNITVTPEWKLIATIDPKLPANVEKNDPSPVNPVGRSLRATWTDPNQSGSGGVINPDETKLFRILALDTGLTPRQYYAYKIQAYMKTTVAHPDGIQDTDNMYKIYAQPVIRILDQAPFVQFADLTIETFTEAYMKGTSDGIPVLNNTSITNVPGYGDVKNYTVTSYAQETINRDWVNPPAGNSTITSAPRGIYVFPGEVVEAILPAGSTDPADTNRDGTIDAVESATYNGAIFLPNTTKVRWTGAGYYSSGGIPMIVNSRGFIGDINGTTNYIQLYRRRANQGTEDVFKPLFKIPATGPEITAGNTVDARGNAISGYEYEDIGQHVAFEKAPEGGVDTNVVYQYKAVLVVNGKEYPNRDAWNISTVRWGTGEAGTAPGWPRPLNVEGSFNWGKHSVHIRSVKPTTDAEIYAADPVASERKIFFSFGSVRYMGSRDIEFIIKDNNPYVGGASAGGFGSAETPMKFSLGRNKNTAGKLMRAMQENYYFDSGNDFSTYTNPTFKYDPLAAANKRLIITGIVGGIGDESRTIGSGTYAGNFTKQYPGGGDTMGDYKAWVIMRYKDSNNQYVQIRYRDDTGADVGTATHTDRDLSLANSAAVLRNGTNTSLLERDGWILGRDAAGDWVATSGLQYKEPVYRN